METQQKIHKQTWLAFVNEETANLLNQLSQNNKLNVVINLGNINQAIEHLKKDNKHSLLLIDISNCDNLQEKISQLASYCQAETVVVAFGNKDGINFYRQLKRLGIDEYFKLPLNSDEFLVNISALHSNKGDLVENKATNPLVTFISARGGLGNTTLALNFSWILANELKFDTCFLDFDLFFGNSLLSVNIDSNLGLTQALTNVDRLDDVFLKRLTLEVSENFSILGSEQPFEQVSQFNSENTKDLVNLITQSYKYCVVDFPHGITPEAHPFQYSSTFIFILVDFSLTSIRDTVRLINLYKNRAPFAKIKIVAIKNPQAKAAEITSAQFEEAIKQPIDFVLPFDRNVTLSSLNTGNILTLYKPKHKIVQVIRSIVQYVTNTKPQKTTKQWWNFSSKRD